MKKEVLKYFQNYSISLNTLNTNLSWYISTGGFYYSSKQTIKFNKN